MTSQDILAQPARGNHISRHFALGFAAKLLLTLVAGSVMASAAAVYAETLSEVLGRHHQARGGLEKVQAVHTVRMTGAVEAGGFVTEFVVLRDRPNRIRIEMDLDGERLLRVFDGSQSWGINPLEGQNAPTALSEASAANLRAQAPFDGVLMDPAAHGATLTLGGREVKNGIDSWRVDVRSADGPEQSYWIDAKSFRAHERRSIWNRDGGFDETTTRWSEHRLVEGVLFAHRQETFGRHVTKSASAMSSTSTPPRATTYKSIEVNVAVDSGRFSTEHAR